MQVASQSDELGFLQKQRNELISMLQEQRVSIQNKTNKPTLLTRGNTLLTSHFQCAAGRNSQRR